MRLVASLTFLLMTALLTIFLSVGCDTLTTEVNNNTYYDTTLGKDCLRCHADNDNAIQQPKGQWANSRHASPELIEAKVTMNGTSRETNKCGPQCHTSEGFIAFAANGSVSAQNAPSVIDCFTCHMPHTGVYGSWQMDTLRGFVKPAILEGDFDYDMGLSNMCVTCHQAPTVPVIPAGALTVRLDTLGMDGPHSSPQAQMLIGKGGFRFGNINIINSHASVTTQGGCLKCHFGVGVGYEFGEHTFRLEDDLSGEPYLANCNITGCHASPSTLTSFDNSPNQVTIRTLSDSLAELLIGASILTGEDDDTTEYFADSTVSAGAARILYNYLFVKNDRSRGVHNTKYALTLLQESVAYWDSIPKASFTADTLRGCAPLTVNFTNSSTGHITSYIWAFGSTGDSATTPNATETFSSSGSYLVELTVRGTGGEDTYARTVIVDSLPTVDITASVDTVAIGVPVVFSQSVTHATKFLWDYGDGRLDSTSVNPSISYSAEGTYIARLTVMNACNTAMDSALVVVTPPPIVGVRKY